MKREEAGLDERKRQYVEEQRKPIPAPAFPQPPVIEVKLVSKLCKSPLERYVAKGLMLRFGLYSDYGYDN